MSDKETIKPILDKLDSILVILSLYTINDTPKCMKMQLQEAFKAVQDVHNDVKQLVW